MGVMAAVACAEPLQLQSLSRLGIRRAVCELAHPDGLVVHAEESEAAFHTTFLLLARKPLTVKKRDSLANWLHGGSPAASPLTPRSTV